tara:strand:- start:10499 stop:11800 length:1302 start_codon:yes stop_codon:yes gene_type:complete
MKVAYLLVKKCVRRGGPTIREKFMRKHVSSRILFAILGVLSLGAVSAHHSAVVFDGETSIQKTGTVTQFIWRNPHLIINMEVLNEAGEKVLWKIEGQSIAAMTKAGFKRDVIAVGDKITVKMHPLTSGAPGGLIQGLIAADGTPYSMGGDSDAPEEPRLVYPALMPYEPPPAGETWQDRERKTRPASLPIVADGTGTGDGATAGLTAGALDPENLAKERPPAPFDLTGMWRFRGEDEYRANYGSFEFKPTPKLTPKGKAYHDAYMAASVKGERFGDPTAECYPAGMPRLMTRYGSLMMLQYPTAIFMVSRLNNEYRVIFLDGRERTPEEALDRNWGGESLGHWEGDTLVVETTGFTDDNHLIQAGIKTGTQLKIVERIQMINNGNTLVSHYTFTDPEHWVGEWKHVKFRDRVLRSDVREANCLYKDNAALPGM